MSGERFNSGWVWRVLTILTKELTDHFRDKRSIVLAFIYPMLGPVLLAGGLGLMGGIVKGVRNVSVLEIPAVGAEYVADLDAYLASAKIDLIKAPPDPEGAVLNGLAPLVLVFPKEAQGTDRYEVTMLTDLSRVANVRATARVQGAIESFNRLKAEKAAVDAGLPKDYAALIKIRRQSVARPDNIAIFFYNMMPPLIMFMIFLAGVHIAIDTTCGERERGSLEPLLIAPVERWELLLAKTGTAFVFTAATMAVNIATYDVLLNLAAARSDRLLPPPDHMTFVAMFVISLPVMFVAVALQMSIAVVTRSMKEAQIYLGLLPLVPALPGMIMIFMPLLTKDWFYGVPVLGQMMLFSHLATGDTVTGTAIFAATVSTLVFGALIFWQAARLFTRERMFLLA